MPDSPARRCHPARPGPGAAHRRLHLLVPALLYVFAAPSAASSQAPQAPAASQPFSTAQERLVDTAPLSTGAHQAVVNDVRLWYRVAGRDGGVPVVYLHGGPGEGSQSFATLAGPALERTLRLVYLDQRGSGRSERPWTNAYSLDLLVDDLEQLRRAWGVPRLALVGHSVGTIVAMEYGAKYPEHVSRLVLAAAGPDIPATFNIQCDRLARANPAVYARAVADAKPGASIKCNVYGGAFAGGGLQAFVNGNMFPRPETERLVNEADRAGGLRNTGELSEALRAAGLLDYRFRDPARLTMPVLIIAGGRDHQANVEPQRAFAARLPNGRILEYPDAGHFMFVEEPDRFARDVTAFLTGSGGATSTPASGR